MTELRAHPSPRIAVVVDGSPAAVGALRWAVRGGHLHCWPLKAVLTWSYLEQHHTGEQRFDPRYTDADAASALDTAVRSALGEHQREHVEGPWSAIVRLSGLLDASAGQRCWWLAVAALERTDALGS